MQELVPIVIGLVLGASAGSTWSAPRLVVGLSLASVAGGVAVAWSSGELAHSIGYAIFDAGVIASFAVLAVVARRLASRHSRSRARRGATP